MSGQSCVLQTTELGLEKGIGDFSNDGETSNQFRKSLTIRTSNYKSMFGLQPLSNYNSQESMGLGSFTIKSTPAPPKVPVEALLNYLSENIDKIKVGSLELLRLEELTSELLAVNQEVIIMRILKDNGWIGSRYQTYGDHQTLDVQLLLQALSNYYLRVKKLKISTSLFNLLGPDVDSRGLGKIVPFCPDMLLSYLRHNQFPPTDLKASSFKNIDSVPCISFTGACMLVDISGFSKFSGAMCSKGVHGLDELRHATNGFLGHFVRIVYDFDGDVIAFAGDALICVFTDLEKPVSLSTPSPSILPPKPIKGSNSVRNCCFRAMQCAAILKNHEASSTMTTMSLSTHIGLSYGDMKMAFLGGLNDQFVYVMNGQCVSALSSCVTDAQSKQVVCTRECLDYALEHGDVNCCEVVNSSSKSRFPNILIDDDASVLQIAQSTAKRQSFHERLGMIKKFSVYLGSTSAAANSMPKSPPVVSDTASNSVAESIEMAEAYNAVDYISSLASHLQSNDEIDDVEVVMLKKKSNAIKLEDSTDICPSPQEREENSLVIATSPGISEVKLQTGVSFLLEKTGQLSVDSGFDTSISGKSPGGLSDVSPSIPLTYSRKYQSNESLVNPSSRFYSNPQSSIYNFEKQFSERSSVALDDVGIYQASFVENIAMFVPVVILAAACNGTMDTLGELRQVTTVFIELKSYDPVKHSDPRCLQPFFLMAQQCLQESGGFLRQFLVDDKGCVLIAMWGTPSFAFSNNSSRALYFAVSVNKKSAEMEHCCSVGITTGTVFCGTVGANERCDYAGVGTDVNMAARLMCKADGGVLVDRLTYQSFNQEIKALFTEQFPVHLKGSPEPVTPFKYTSSLIPPMRAVDDIGGKNVFLKRKVMTLISEMLDRQGMSHNSSGNLTAVREFTRELSVSSRGNVEVLVVTGATGTGKTVAAHYFRHASLKQGVPVINLKANSSISAVPYGIIKELILELVPIGRKGNYLPHENSFVSKLAMDCYPCEDLKFREYVTKQLEILLGLTDEANSRNHELLNRLSNSYSESSVNLLLEEQSNSFSLSDPSSKVDASMPSMSSIIYQVLIVLLGGAPCSLIIENYHFCDELSWHEILQIISHKEQLLTMCIMLTIRTAPLDLRTLSSDEIPNSRSFSVSPIPSRQSMHYNFKGLSQIRAPTLSVTNLQKAGNSSSSISVNSSAKLIRPHSILKLDAIIDENYQSGNTFSMEESFRALLRMPETIVHELTSLTQEEVKHILVDVLGDGNVADDLVTLVSNVCSGNIYWCKSIASFIKERDIFEFLEVYNNGKNANPLRDLVLCRMERLSPDLILILKHVSVIGHEFNESLVQGIMNVSTKQRKGVPIKLRDQLALLEKNGFIYLLEEHPEPIYGFQNELIRNTLYELLPPGDAAAIHCHIAQYLEREFAEDLRPFYPTLAFNFSNGGKAMRHLAFKYQLKAANHAINHGAYNDGLVYTQAAEELVDKKVEYIVLIEVVQHAISDLTKLLPKPAEKCCTVTTFSVESEVADHGLRLKSQSSSPKSSNSPVTFTPHKQASHLSNQYSRSFYCEHESDLKAKILAYQKVKDNCEDSLARFRAAENLVLSKSGKGKKTDIRALLMRKNTSHKLSWQLSTALPQAIYGGSSDTEKDKLKDVTPEMGMGAEDKPAVDESPPVYIGADGTRSEDEGESPSLRPAIKNQGCCVVS